MDLNTVRDLEEAIRQLNEALNDQSSALTSYAAAAKQSSDSINNNTTATNASSKATNNAAQGVTRYSQLSAEVDAQRIKSNQELSFALKNSWQATKSFGTALVNAESSLTKYGGSAKQLGGAAWDIGKNFGIAGKLIGGALAGLGLAANSLFVLNQNIIDFRDGFAKQAGVLPITTTELSNLAKEAGFAYNRMPMLAKTVTNLGENLLALGGNAGESAVRFMNIANVGEETRQRFRRMGLKQEELLEYQSYYVEVQRAGGQAQANRRKTDSQIQAESLVYAENLLLLSALTGEKASDVKDAQNRALLIQEEQAAVLAENREIAKLEERERQGDAEAGIRARAMRKEQEDRQTLIKDLAVTVGESEAFAVGSLIRTGGTYTGKTAKFSQIQLAQLAQAYMTSSRSEKDRMRLRDLIADAQGGRIENFNRVVQILGKGAQDLVTIDDASLQKLNRLGPSLSEAAIAAEKQRDAAGEPGRDPLMDAATSIQELEIAASKEFQELLEMFDPFRNGLDMFKKAAIGAAVVLGGGALIAGVAKVIGGKFGKLGSPGNPMHAKIVSGPSGVVSGIGTKLKGLFSRTAAPAAAAAGVKQASTAAAAAGPLARSGTGASALAGAAGSPGGSKVGIFLTGLSAGLRAFGNPGTLKAAVMVSGIILVLGGAIAGATWIMGKALPSLASGLKSFEDVDGTNLKKVGIGMAGLGVGLLAMGGSGIAKAMGNMAQWITGDTSNPIENLGKELVKFQNMQVDEAKVEKNSKAFIAFNEMVAKATEINGTVAGALSRAFSKFFEVEIPLDKFKNFSEIDINAEQVGKNATAFKLFAEAMSSYKGYGTLNTLQVITRALSGNVFSFFQAIPTDDPIKRFENFSKIKIEGEQIKINATAFKDFANAMAEYKGGPGVFEALSQLTGSWLRSLFGGDGPVEAFKKFAQEDFGPNMERNVGALTKYADATSKAGGGAFGAGSGSGAGGDAGGGGETSTSSGGAGSTDAVGLGEPGSSMKSLGDIVADSGTSSGSGAIGLVPDISSGADAIIKHATSLSGADRTKFFETLSSQGMERATKAAAAGNQEAANAFLDSANRYYMLSKSSGMQSSNDTSFNTPSGTTQVAGMGSMFGTMISMARGAVSRSKAGEVLNFTDRSGRFENFAMLDDDMQQAVVAAASEYKQATGRNMQVNSGRRTRQDQERLWNETVRAGRPGIGPTGMLVAKPGHSPHERGNAIDLQEGKSDQRAKQILEKYGMYQRYGSKDPVHYELKRAADGGIFDQDLNETSRKLDSLNPNSVIANLGKKPVEEPVNIPTDNLESEIDLTPELLSMIEGKLEKVLVALENNQSTHEKILKNSM